MRRLLSALPFVIVACSYDWTVGPRGTAAYDAGAGTDGALADDAGNGSLDANGPTCAGLEAQMGLARTGILRCGSTCGQTVKDACLCDLPVVDAESSEAKTYAQAAAAYREAGCATCDKSCSQVLRICFNGLCT